MKKLKMVKLKKKKGFTLIELLAVILILGVIALIAVPTINSIIEDSKKQSLKTSALAIGESAEKQCQLEQLKDEGITEYYTIEDGELSSPLDIKNLPDSGSIKVDSECNADLAISDGTYCAVKKGEQVTITSNVNDCNVVETTNEACFTFEAATKTITRYNYDGTTCTTDVSIPSDIGGVAVEKIGDAAFTNMQLSSLILPNSITEVGRLSFAYNNLRSVTLSKNIVSLSYGSFAYNQLDKLVISNSVKNIGYGSFAFNNIKSVVIPNSVETIDYAAFAYNQLESITIPDSVTSIGEHAFANNELSKINIPEKISIISGNSFSNNNLTSVTIPDNIIEIGNSAFAYNQLENIIIPDSVTKIGESAFSNNKISTLTLPSSIAIIEGGAFNNNQLKDTQAFIYDRDSRGNIDTSTLISYGGAKKEGVEIPDNVIIIDGRAFRSCKLKSVVIPKTVVYIGNGAFNDNNFSDTDAYIYKRDDEGNIDNTTLVSYGGARRAKVVIPDTVTRIEQNCFIDNYITSITIPKTVTYIGPSAFNNNNLEDEEAFIYARKEDGTIDETRIVSYAGIKDNVTIPDTVTTIDQFAFQWGRLNYLTIPDSVTTINEGAFRDNQLVYVNIGSGIQTIASDAFELNSDIVFTIKRTNGSVSGSPWGASSGSTVDWIGSN